MVVRANKKLGHKFKRKQQIPLLVGDEGVLIPINFVGLSLHRKMSIDRVNDIYGRLLEKVKDSHVESKKI